MKKIFPVVIVVSLVLLGCGKEKIQQGEITYEITYPYTELNGIMDVMLPKKMTVVFKGDKMIATIEKSKIFKTDIYSESNTKTLKMRLDFGSENVEASLSDEDLVQLQENQPKYDVGQPIKTDTVAGLEATFYNVTSTNDNIGKFNCAFSNDLSINQTEWYTSYIGSIGVPLIYVVERYGIIMHLRASNFRSREVMDSEFETSQPFKQIPYTNYEKKVTELFELIIEE
jgi:major membrane immunogen (membrane-anchored lipoprotein)